MKGAGTKRFAWRVVATAWLVLAIGCSESTPTSGTQADETDAGPLSVYVVNAPLETLARRIGGEHVEVAFPAPPGVDPAYWMPTPDVIRAYQSADLILENGAGYAAWLRQATLPRRTRVDTSAAFADRLIATTGAVTHGHGPEGAHSHGGTAFTTWLDPGLATLQARAIADAMIERRPQHEAELRAGLERVEAELAALDARLEAALAPLRGRTVLFSHPVYQYLARRYGLTGHTLHWEPGEPAPPEDWEDVARWVEEGPTSVILFEGEPHAEVEARLRALRIETIVFAPGGGAAKSKDWLEVMAENVAAVEQAL